MYSVFLDKNKFFILKKVKRKKIFKLKDKEELLLFLKNFKTSDRPQNPYVFHFFYESGFIFQNLDQEFNLDPETIVLLFLEYEQVEEYRELPAYLEKDISINLINGPSFDDYSRKFKMGYEMLLAGECYQFNLTEESHYSFNVLEQNDIDPLKVMGLLWKDQKNRGAFAHATYDSDEKKLYLSNSPECLYKIKNKNIVSMPIKGTIPLSSEVSVVNLWNKMIIDTKNQAELFMITDLIRNDLSSIDKPLAKVICKKAPLIVPGLLHQYSIIECPLDYSITLDKVLSALIPGGSITGAPKKNVMRILNRIESYQRHFYCGSTILWHKNVHSASINIRSSVVDIKNNHLRICAGGGITLRSDPSDEFSEMLSKLNSFKNLLTRSK